MSSSVGQTDSAPSNSEPEVDSLLAPHGRPQINFSGLSLKTVQNATIYMKHLVGVQNCQAGCYRMIPFLALIKDGIRQGAEPHILPQAAGQSSMMFTAIEHGWWKWRGDLPNLKREQVQ
jgi:hypothetical protein